ncbi:MAG: DUF1566 domain-containing protein [Legionellales bacterium]|nr:DUF1566 domain-containing protein [Legionellales bacterium]
MKNRIKYGLILVFFFGATQHVLSQGVALNNIPDKTTLSSSVLNLALSVSNQQRNSALIGNTRDITIQNVGNEIALEIAIHYPNWPAGTSATSTCDSHLSPAASCVISIHPGPESSSHCDRGTLAIPSTITISARNAPAIKFYVMILSYGCIYQGGYLFSVNDNYAKYPRDLSIGGKVVSLNDQTYAIAWDSSIGCTTEPYNNCAITLANSIENGNYYFPTTKKIDPDGNTYRIYHQLSDTLSYAAGICRQNSVGYSDWYLPAICELGYYTPSSLNDSGCGTESAPYMQNILSNLTNDHIGNLGGLYWSSTEDGYSPNINAWFQYTAGGGDSFQSGANKASQIGVRCVRAVTP